MELLERNGCQGDFSGWDEWMVEVGMFFTGVDEMGFFGAFMLHEELDHLLVEKFEGNLVFS